MKIYVYDAAFSHFPVVKNVSTKDYHDITTGLLLQ